MTLVSKMTALYDRLYPLSDRFGIPTHTDFTFLNRDTQLYTVVVPRPQVSSPPVNKLTVWRESGVEINMDMVYVTGISRQYTELRKGTICTIGGKPHTILWVDVIQTVTYSVLCRPERAR